MEARNSRNEDEINLMEYIRPLAPKWKLLLLIVILGGIASFFLSRLLPKQYRSTAVVFVQQSSGAAGILRNLPISLGTGGTNNAYLLAILQSNTLKLAVIDKLDLMHNKYVFPKKTPTTDEALEVLDKILVITDSKNGTLKVSVTARNPELAARIANTAIDFLGKFVVTSSKRKVDFTAQKLKETEEKLIVAENDLKIFMERYKVASVEDQVKQMIMQLGALDAKILTVNAELTTLSSDLQSSANLSELVRKEVRAKSLNASLTFLRKQRSTLYNELMKLPTLGPKYADIQRRLMVLGKTFELLTEQYQLARVTQKGEDGDYQILDRARPNPKKVAPRCALLALAGSLLSFLIAALFINITSRRTPKRSLPSRMDAKEEDLRPVER